MTITIRVMAVRPNGRTFTVQAQAGGMPLAVDLPYLPGETDADCRRRVRRALEEMLGQKDQEVRQRRRQRLRQALVGQEWEVERPWGPIHYRVEAGGRVLAGRADDPRHQYLVTIREADGSERECCVTAGKNGLFSVDVGEGRTLVGMVPMSAHGVHGPEIPLG